MYKQRFCLVNIYFTARNLLLYYCLAMWQFMFQAHVVHTGLNKVIIIYNVSTIHQIWRQDRSAVGQKPDRTISTGPLHGVYWIIALRCSGQIKTNDDDPALRLRWRMTTGNCYGWLNIVACVWTKVANITRVYWLTFTITIRMNRLILGLFLKFIYTN